MNLLAITSSNDGADDGVAVGVDLKLVKFLVRSFRITGSRINEVGGVAATSIETSAIQHAMSLIDGGNGYASLKYVVFSNGRTLYVFQKSHNLFYKL